MDFKLAMSLDVLTPGQVRAGVGVYSKDEKLWSEEKISLCKTGKTSYQEQKSTKEFEELLPQLTHVKELAVPFRISKSFFNAICSMHWLERLEICEPSQSTLQPISNLKNLTHLELGSCPKLVSLEPLTQLKGLKVLGLIGNYSGINDLRAIGKMTHLQGLLICGNDYKVQRYQSLNPLASLVNLIYLGLGAVRTEDRSLSALCHMKSLRCLHLVQPAGWPLSEYVKVYQCLPDLGDEELKLAATDAAYQKENRIR